MFIKHYRQSSNRGSQASTSRLWHSICGFTDICPPLSRPSEKKTSSRGVDWNLITGIHEPTTEQKSQTAAFGKVHTLPECSDFAEMTNNPLFSTPVLCGRWRSGLSQLNVARVRVRGHSVKIQAQPRKYQFFGECVTLLYDDISNNFPQKTTKFSMAKR